MKIQSVIGVCMAICVMVACGDPVTDAGVPKWSGFQHGAIGVSNLQPIMDSSSDAKLFDSLNQPIVSQYTTTSSLGLGTVQPIMAQKPLEVEAQRQTFNQAILGEAKPIPYSFVQPMVERATASKGATITAPVQQAFPAAKSPQPIKEFKFVNAPLMNEFQTLPVIELANVIQPYAVPQTHTTQENIKQPITQPIWQPYLQRYEQRAVPVVQPIVNRVVQPVIHRQLRPFLTSETIQGPAQQPISNSPIVREFKNEAVVGSDMSPLALEDRSKKPALPVVEPQPDLSKRQAAQHTK